MYTNPPKLCLRPFDAKIIIKETITSCCASSTSAPICNRCTDNMCFIHLSFITLSDFQKTTPFWFWLLVIVLTPDTYIYIH